MSFDATTWVEQIGFMKSFAIYAGILAFTTLGLPLVYFYGKRIRAFTAGKLDKTYSKEETDDENKYLKKIDLQSKPMELGS